MTRRRTGELGSDRGETLVELLVSIAILGLAGVAVMAGLLMSVRASTIHRNETTGGAQIRAFAEDIQNYITANPSSYVDCPTASSYSAATVGFTTPTGFAAPTYTVTSLSQNSSGQLVAVACANDVGLQQVTLSLANNDGRTTEKLVFVLRKPCDTSSVTACS